MASSIETLLRKLVVRLGLYRSARAAVERLVLRTTYS
ncbi:hypothetical protein BH23GEM2_BH23GEM2_11740 [soil metagenome]